MNRFIYLLIPFLFNLNACTPEPSATIPKNPYAIWASESPGLKIETLPSKKGSWQSRSFALDRERTSLLKAINEIDGIEEVPETSPLKNKFETILNEIQFPSSVHALSEKLIYGIYFVKGLGSSGLSAFLMDNSGRIQGGIMFLDTDLLDKGSNDWASFKDNTAFRSAPNESLSIQISNENNIQETLRYIILHELGHVLSVTNKYVPDFREETRDFRKFALYKDVWESETFSPYEKTFFPERSKIKFYRKDPSLSLFPEGLMIYRKLKNSSFVSLYAATNADDTFAEAFVQYVYVVLEKKPYHIQLKKNGEPEFEWTNPIEKEGGRRFRDLFLSIDLK